MKRAVAQVKYVFQVGSISPDNTYDFTCTGSGLRQSPKPRDYLKFAENDLDEASQHPSDVTRHAINAVSNAKRALHLQVESLCDSFSGGLLKGNLRSFPAKLEFLERCGVIGQRLLRKLNSVRNAVEHDYKFATLDDAELAVDVAELFIGHCRLYESRFPCSVGISPPVADTSGTVYVQAIDANWKTGVIRLQLTDAENVSRTNQNSYQNISILEPEFFEWVRFLVACID